MWPIGVSCAGPCVGPCYTRARNSNPRSTMSQRQSANSLLIVEDEAVVTLDLTPQLEGLGYTVAGVVASGEQAVALVGAAAPDLVLMDLRLRGRIDGIEAVWLPDQALSDQGTESQRGALSDRVRSRAARNGSCLAGRRLHPGQYGPVQPASWVCDTNLSSQAVSLILFR